ncbi:hybrid non-ribosomal peptide synthetase/type I polyketide synthase [Burkholderia plantarii]|uniref:hybrid non-ribosomal peptide synthetase/type I polyketide synthase n=1 Tax=Burkholderia plantarii TaxID=41899 RepID=UPI0006D8D0B9|nr:hybrid non-ribosomal peptide synthetase/type I polyketide synthase [Burkholderia plantarii]ALK32479.1 thiotemplate mechanism natural product synthetase [Burkholderia plantarii]
MNLEEHHFATALDGAAHANRLQPTDAQRRLWLVAGNDIASATYNVPFVIRLRGRLDVDALERALATLPQRHPPLRARFRGEGEQFVIETGHASPALRRLDLAATPAQGVEQAIDQQIERESTHAFDLRTEAPMRSLLMRVDDVHHVLLMNVHHVVFDSWSLRILLDDLATAYNAYRLGQAPEFAPLDYQLEDETPDEAEIAYQREYWRARLDDAPALHAIPTDRPRPRVARNRGARLGFTLDPALAEPFRKLTREAGVTPYMAGLAAFGALLHRYSSAGDIVIGSPFANRFTKLGQERIGFYSNLLPLRLSFEPATSFSALLAQTRDTVLDAFDHANLSFDEIVDGARPTRSLAHAPLFQVMFDMVGGSLHAFALDGLEVEASLLDTGTSKYDLNFELEERASGFAGVLEYDTDLFDAGTAERFVGHFERLLASVLRAPEAPIAQSALLSADELAEVRRHARPARPLGEVPFVSLPQRIRDQARATPEVVALVHVDERLTYRELDARIERLATRIRAAGVTPGQRVATFVSYSPDNVIAYLAVERAGAVFLPLAPSDQRVADKLADSQPALIVSRRADAPALAGQPAPPVLLIDDDDAGPLPVFEPVRIEAHDPAYVIYTSGSTGKPKGVEVSHGSLHASFFGWCDAYRFGERGQLVSLQLPGPTFDLYVGDVARALAVGGRLVMCPREWLLEAETLHRLIETERVTFADFPPVVLRQLIRHCNEAGKRLDSFDTLVCGADVWFGHELQAAQALCAPHARVLGSYGVTEAAIDSSVFDPAEHALAPLSVVPIGRPLSSCELYVADSLLQLVPVGLPGELLIAGTPVANGYLNRPELNAEKFIEGGFDEAGRFVPGSGAGSMRIYRTGDVCRLLADGTIEFLGRRDNQVKIRGLRVELGEIEGVLAEHPDVEQSAVIAHGTNSDDRVLIGYAVSSTSAVALLDYLRARLPAHMVPVALERLPELPLTPSGKIDRKRLPIPDFSIAQAERTAPRNAGETRMLALWQAVLGDTPLGVHDNFFHCGGHSLAAAKLVSQINRAFGTGWNMSVVFERPTIAELAALAIEEMLAAKFEAAPDAAQGAAPAADLAANADPSLLSFGQRSLWFVAMSRQGASDYNLPDALRLEGELNHAALAAALRDVVARHPILRTTYSSSVRNLPNASGGIDHEPSLVLHAQMSATLDTIEAFGIDPDELTGRLHAEAARAFDLTAGPVFRATLFVLGARRHVLCMNFHHIAVDGQSLAVFWRDLESCYNAHAAGRAPALAPLSGSHAAHVARERAFVGGSAHARQIAFWRERLAALPAPLTLGRPALAAAQAGRAASSTARFALGRDLAAAIETLAREAGCTPFVVYTALYVLLLRRESGQTDVVTGIPVSTRHDEALEHVMGFFVNTLPLRVRFDELPNFRALLQRVRQLSLEVLAHAEVPFETLVQALNPPRTPGRNPIFQTSFTCDLDDAATPRLTALQASRIAIDTDNAKLDLDMSVEKLGGTVQCRLLSRHPGCDGDELARIGAHFAALAQAVVGDPDMHWDALAIDADTLPASLRPADSGLTLLSLLEPGIAEHAERVALERDGMAIRYRGMDALAAALAQRLAGLGIAAGARVGIFTGSHPHMVTAMLGILRAGAAFVPMDPAQLDRGWNQHVVTDAALAAVVSRGELAEMAATLGLPVIDLDRLDTAAPAAAPRLRAPRPDDCACVIYTSGSTGVPKGAVLSHRNLVATSVGIRRAMRTTPASRVAQFFAPSFDGVLAEVLPALMAGGTVVFGSRMQLLPGPAMVEWLARERITHLAIVPSALGLMPQASLPELETIVMAGEATPAETARRWAPGRRMVNCYGPTECAICVSMCEYWEENAAMVLAPLDGLRFHVLDETLAEVSPGDAGELYLGGDSIGHGYLGLPGRTAQTFVADPFGAPGARLYRTGDTVRRIANGRVEFVGRADRQVKIRGNRIELDAVADALSAIPGVRQAAALARVDQHGQKELVAYVVASCSKAELLAALRAKVPPAMVPSSLTFLDAMPLGRTGKIDMKALAALRPSHDAGTAAVAAPAGGSSTMAAPFTPAAPAPRAAGARRAPRVPTAERVAALWCELLERDAIEHDENFFDAGGHSLRAVALHAQLVEAFGPAVTLTDIFAYPTIAALAAQIDTLLPPESLLDALPDELEATPAAAPEVDHDAIAIIGMVGRFPGAPDLPAFWRGLLAGYEGGRFLSEEECLALGVDPALLRNPNFVRHVSPLDGAPDFDAGYFGLSPREAQMMDPQQRLFLEMAHELLERAGYGNDASSRPVGVFASCSFSHYLMQNVVPNLGRLDLDSSHLQFGNDKDFLATRTAYKLNLRGPALSISTACSSSLVAIHQACASVRNGETEMALAGAVSLDPDTIGYLHAEGGIMSADGHCRPFDASAGGTTNGSGGGLVLLKSLAAARRDGDTIHAVIRGSAINNDGADKVSYTAPSVAGQAAAIRDAMRAARVTPDTIDYVEAHGTGTRLGDPIEVRALTDAYTELAVDGPLPAGSCALGSVKGNIGHLDAAAGMAGLIKIVLSLENGTLPPSINCSTPNPEIRFERTPFSVVTQARAWPRRADRPRRAGISAFGVGGTNAHLIVEEAPPAGDARRHPGADAVQLVPLSARTPAALARQAEQLAEYLASTAEASGHGAAPRDVAYTMQTGRSAHRHRAFALSDGNGRLVEPLRLAVRNTAAQRRANPPVVFLFPGQGSQYLGMGADLYRAGGAFRDAFDRCADGFARHLDRDLRDFVLGPADDAVLRRELNETRYTQPALFALSYALACQLREYGVVPKAVIGHSLGELVGACVAEMLDLDDALALVARRAAVMQRQPAGAMLAVEAPESALDDLLATGCEIAAVNGVEYYVLAGPEAAIAAAEASCARTGLACRRLATSHAFHSASMEQAITPINLASPALAKGNGIRLISNRSGRWFDEADRADAGYWGDHARQPVQFHRGVETLLSTLREPILIEVGPGRALSSLLRRRADLEPARLLTSLPHPQERRTDQEVLLKSLGTLWTQGVSIDWARLHDGHEPKRIALPTYPFERTRHWLDRPAGGSMYGAARDGALVFTRGDGPNGSSVMRCELHEQLWFLDEHRIFEGDAVLPGTGCLELVRRAFAAWRGVAELTLSDIYFPAALVLPRGGRREARVRFATRGATLEFTLESRQPDEGGDGHGDEWLPHATGTVAASVAPAAAIDSPAELRARHAMGALDAARQHFATAFAEYGPRWHSAQAVWLGERQGLKHGLARLRLDSAFAGDLREHALHPALLDLATAFLNVCTRPDAGAIPFHYGELRCHAPLTAECYSFVVETAPGRYDVTIFSADGDHGAPVVLAEVRGYSLRRLPGGPDARRGRDLADWCRVPRWRDEAASAGRARLDAPWLVFADDTAVAGRLAAHAPAGSLTIVPGERFAHADAACITLRANAADDYRRLLEWLGQASIAPSQIVYGWSAADPLDAFERLALLVQALGARHLATTLTLVTRGWRTAQAADDGAATMAGLLQAVNWEFPKLLVRHLDRDDDSDATLTALADELAHATVPREQAAASTLAFAAGRRQTLRYVPIESEGESLAVRDGGTYLITGGLDGIGYEIAHHLATAGRGVKLGLVSRSGLDGRHATDTRTDARRQRVAALEQAGAEVLVLQADIGDAQQSAQAFSAVRARFGEINGIAHSAGLEASGLLGSGTPQAWRRVLGPKVDGTRHLVAQLGETRPDFVLLCSSLASVLGGLGQADYSAANASLDASARHLRRRGIRAVSVNWDAWAETGMALAYAARAAKAGKGAAAPIRGLSNQEGRALFALAAAGGEAQVTVSKYGSIERLIERELAQRHADSGARAGESRQDGGAETVEAFVSRLWRDMLGVDALTADDDFFELGGHSLLATQLISRIRERYDHCLTLAEFLDMPTIARIAASIEAAQDQPRDAREPARSDDPAIRYCIVPLNRAGSKPPFFCVPGMGGNVTQLLPLSEALGKDRPFIGLQCLGLDGIAEPHGSVEQMAAHYIACMKSIQANGPYHLGGHSLGGKVAYEMARQLLAAGDQVGLLALFDSAAPPYTTTTRIDDCVVTEVILSIFAYYTGKPDILAGASAEQLRELSLEQQLAEIEARLERHGVIHAQTDGGAIRGLFNVYRAAADLGPRYDPPKLPLPLPVLLFKAAEPMPEGMNLPETRDTEGWGWEHFTTQPVRAVTVPGDHFSCLMEQSVGAVATPLRAALDAGGAR